MIHCPVCGATLEQDFGMVTCGQCQSVLMIDISGQVQVGSEQAPPEPEAFHDELEGAEEDVLEENFESPAFEPHDESSQTEESSIFNAANSSEDLETSSEETVESEELTSSEEWEGGAEDVDDFEDPLSPNSSQEASDWDGSEETWQNPEDVETPEDAGDEEEEGDLHSFSEEPASFEADEDSAVFQGADESEESIEEFPMAATPDPKPVNVTEFANSQESNLEDGELVYDVLVSRVDSKELREALKYVLLDEKLNLDHQELLQKLKAGVLKIPDLNPIKAKRIVEQLQFLDLDIQWAQKRVIMETVEPELGAHADLGEGDDD